MVNINAQELTADDDVVKISGVKTAATLNLGTGEIALSENDVTGVLTLASMGNGVFQGLLPAQQFSGNIECEHNGSTYIYSFTDMTLEAAKIKNIDLTIK